VEVRLWAWAHQRGWTEVRPDTLFSAERGYGFEPGSAIVGLEAAGAVGTGGEDAVRGHSCSSSTPFSFSVALPEGNYLVRLTLGEAQGASDTTVKVEARRLMRLGVRTAPSKLEQRSFTVNARRPSLLSGQSVRLKGLEADSLSWDNKLTLEFNGSRPSVSALQIERDDKSLTLFITGDSTVTDQDAEPWAAWGQMLPLFLKPGIAVCKRAATKRHPTQELPARSRALRSRAPRFGSLGRNPAQHSQIRSQTRGELSESIRRERLTNVYKYLARPPLKLRRSRNRLCHSPKYLQIATSHHHELQRQRTSARAFSRDKEHA